MQDLDKPRCAGAFWGEVTVRVINFTQKGHKSGTKEQENGHFGFWQVNSSVHKALGCVGTIIDGAIRF